ncbi:hypothetical protein [Rickettsiella endosymbiont of Dermanyssus gallinae]|uniref:hypothetical protein n=1 Tax=Rickettsiella endosymbiont of Dermanyssus gallinae TaxID=2856608 RepID=UPI001C52AAC5|nr:hypothetical protein [Rickettsiella endosymbiont of Dermanyssus gallinae]
MSSNSVYCGFYASIHQYEDDELAGWFSKLKEEFLGVDLRKGFLAELDTKLKISCCNIENYKSIREYMKNSFELLSKDLEVVCNKRSAGTLDKDDMREIKDKIKNFDVALSDMKNFISKEMYDSKLQYIILKLKAILLGIANCFLGRDLQYSKIRGGEHYVMISAGPATHVTPVYILPDRPSISLFFSEQIYKEIDKIGENLPQCTTLVK